jgi:glycerol-3-phosphate acyltransferase PlsX
MIELEGETKNTLLVDADGGDFAPQEIVIGVLEALNLKPQLRVRFFGNQEAIQGVLSTFNYPADRVSIVNCPETITSSESPAEALRKKRSSSIVMCAQACARGEGFGWISAGNTGACMGASLLFMRTIKGIYRPGIAVVVPKESGFVILIDIGANSECKPLDILKFAVMGSAYHSVRFSIPDPKIALLNIGVEEAKGNSLYKSAFEILSKSHLNFIGNLEARDVFNTEAEVIVCDGFTGNILLKAIEGTVMHMISIVKKAGKDSVTSMLGIALLKKSLKERISRLDYEEYGGAFLLGVNGIFIKSHGSSKATAIKNSSILAMESSKSGLIAKISENIRGGIS